MEGVEIAGPPAVDDATVEPAPSQFFPLSFSLSGVAIPVIATRPAPFRRGNPISLWFLQDPGRKHAETGFLRRDRGQMVPAWLHKGSPFRRGNPLSL